MSEDLPLPQTNIEEARILVVDDELDIQSALVYALNASGFKAQGAGSGIEALQLLERDPYELMILDMRMPEMDGMEVMRLAHQLYPNLLIIVLTGYATLESAIAAVKTEAVDYLRKPVSNKDVVEAVRQALQKQATQLHRDRLVRSISEAVDTLRQTEAPTVPLPASSAHTRSIIRVDPLSLDRRNRQVVISGKSSQPITLTEGEAAVLACLMAHPRQVLSCIQLTVMAWNYQVDETEAQNIVRPHIFRLRRKLSPVFGGTKLIYTVRGQGYTFIPPPEEDD